MKTIDINCDMGESFGHYRLGMDEQIINDITSANIACGWHAGDPGPIKKKASFPNRPCLGVCKSRPMVSRLSSSPSKPLGAMPK